MGVRSSVEEQLQLLPPNVAVVSRAKGVGVYGVRIPGKQGLAAITDDQQQCIGLLEGVESLDEGSRILAQQGQVRGSAVLALGEAPGRAFPRKPGRKDPLRDHCEEQQSEGHDRDADRGDRGHVSLSHRRRDAREGPKQLDDPEQAQGPGDADGLDHFEQTQRAGQTGRRRTACQQSKRLRARVEHQQGNRGQEIDPPALLPQVAPEAAIDDRVVQADQKLDREEQVEEEPRKMDSLPQRHGPARRGGEVLEEGLHQDGQDRGHDQSFQKGREPPVHGSTIRSRPRPRAARRAWRGRSRSICSCAGRC